MLVPLVLSFAAGGCNFFVKYKNDTFHLDRDSVRIFQLLVSLTQPKNLARVCFCD